VREAQEQSGLIELHDVGGGESDRGGAEV
jgi:hypothetical protein